VQQAPSRAHPPIPALTPPAQAGAKGARPSGRRSVLALSGGHRERESRSRLPEAAEAERMNAYWRERIAALKDVLEH
jgi:hypothetical protein